jgi:hypothetical protein
VKHRPVIEDGAIDLSPWGRRHALEIAQRLGRLRGVGRLRLDFGKDEKQQQTGRCRQSEQSKPAAQSSVERLHGESPFCEAPGMEPLIPDRRIRCAISQDGGVHLGSSVDERNRHAEATTPPIRCSHTRQGSASIKQTVTAQIQRGNDVLRSVARTYKSIRILGCPEIGEKEKPNREVRSPSLGTIPPWPGKSCPNRFVRDVRAQTASLVKGSFSTCKCV